MTPDRCPSCHAALAAGAQWCTLCYADLRPAAPEPAPAPEPASELTPQPAAQPSALAAPVPAPRTDALTDALHRPELVAASSGGGGRHALRPEDLPVMTSADVDVAGRPGWPCQTCGESVPLEMTACVKCGSPFLADAKSAVKLQVPLLGDLAEMSTGARFAVMAGGAVLVAGLFFGLLLLLAAIF